jgi:hypothetical protein
MKVKALPIQAGEIVSFPVYRKRTNAPMGRVIGEVIKVNRVNMYIREDAGTHYEFYTVFKNNVRRFKATS